TRYTHTFITHTRYKLITHSLHTHYTHITPVLSVDGAHLGLWKRGEERTHTHYTLVTHMLYTLITHSLHTHYTRALQNQYTHTCESHWQITLTQSRSEDPRGR